MSQAGLKQAGGSFKFVFGDEDIHLLPLPVAFVVAAVALYS